MVVRVRLFGHLRAAFGLAGGAKATRRALRAAGCQVTSVDLALATHPPLAAEADSPDSPDEQPSEPPLVDLVHTNPNVLASTPDLLPLQRLTAPIRIGYWAWELEQFPRGWERFFAGYQEIWCPSSFTAQALAQRSPIPVVAVPHLPDWPRLHRIAAARAARQATAPREGLFTFLTLFDYWSTTERKNPLGVIQAFQTAFPPGDPSGPAVRLLIKTSSSDQFPNAAAELRHQTRTDPRILWLDALLSAEQLEALYLTADALVSLHRAEGFGLTLAEAMAIGLPVVATGYSGCLDFMPPGSARLIPWQLTPIARGNGDYRPGASWAEPCSARAVAVLRDLVADPDAARRQGLRGRAAISERLAAQRIAAIVRQRLGLRLLPPA